MKPAPRRNPFALAIALALIVLLAAALPPAASADTGYAALLVLFGPDDYLTQCVALPGSMTAFDLVRVSGLSYAIETAATGGDAICSIEGAGCDYPTETCFCQCAANTCSLWTAWYWDNGRWEIAFDVDERMVPDGGMEAWVWGDGMTEPPVVGFGDICTGVLPDDPPDSPYIGDYPAPPTYRPPANTPYPATPANTPTFWVQPTRAVGATFTATPTRTATIPGGLPAVLLTASAQARAATPTGTPIGLAPALTTTPPPEAAQPTGTVADNLAVAPIGSATPDQVAMLIDASAARVRATALASQSQASAKTRGNGGLWVLGILAALAVAYAVLLTRQRRQDRRLRTSATGTAVQPPPDDLPTARAWWLGAADGLDDLDQSASKEPIPPAEPPSDEL